MNEEFEGWPSEHGQSIVVIHAALEKIAEALHLPVLFERDTPYIWFRNETVGLTNVIGDPWHSTGISQAFVDSLVNKSDGVDAVTCEVLQKLDPNINFDFTD